LSERGYEGLTMRAVADRVEYSVAALYKHFADREELVRALCASDFYAFAQVLNARRGAREHTETDPIERLRGIARSYAEFALQHPEQYRVMFMAPLPIEPAGIEYGDPERDAYALVAHAVQRAQEAGHFEGLDKDLVAQTLWAAMHGVVSLEITHLCAKKRHIPFAPLQARIDTAMEGILLGVEVLAKQQARAKPKSPSAAKGATSSKPVKLPKRTPRPAPRAHAAGRASKT
jgi:AcrR family transcriptional regulator